MKEIKLNKGRVALVDDEDFDALSKIRWSACMSKSKHLCYARASHPWRGQKSVAMHRMIMGDAPEAGMVVDHINHNGLDNQRRNLRWATSSQNALNCHKVNPNGFRGVHRKAGAFVAITAGRHLGMFPDAQQAAGAYNWAAKRLYGEFAILNADATGNIIPEICPSARIATVIEQVAQRGARAEASGVVHKWSLKPQMRPLRLQKDPMRNLINRNGIWYFKKMVDGTVKPVSLRTPELWFAKKKRDQIERDAANAPKVQPVDPHLAARRARARQVLLETTEVRKQSRERRKAYKLPTERRKMWQCGHCGVYIPIPPRPHSATELHKCCGKKPLFTVVEVNFVDY